MIDDDESNKRIVNSVLLFSKASTNETRPKFEVSSNDRLLRRLLLDGITRQRYF